jgi:hypothetical protein
MGSNHPWGQLVGWLVQACIQLHLEILENVEMKRQLMKHKPESRVRLYLFQLEKTKFGLNG